MAASWGVRSNEWLAGCQIQPRPSMRQFVLLLQGFAKCSVLPPVILEGFSTGRSQFRRSVRVIPIVAFLNFNVSSITELSQVLGERSLIEAGHLDQISEVGALGSSKNGHNRKARGLVDKRIKLSRK